VFRLQGADELERAEGVYLPKGRRARAVVLAAARGHELGRLTEAVPKAMLEIAGKPLLAHIAATYRAAGIKDITVVRGYAKERVDVPGLAFADNDAYASTQEVASLACALAAPAAGEGPLVVSYGDVLFRRHILDMLADALAASDDAADAPVAAIAVDTDWRASRNRGPERRPDYVACSLAHGREALSQEVRLKAMASEPGERIDGEWMGIARFTEAGARRLAEAIEAWRAEDRQAFARARMNDLFNRLVAAGAMVKVVYTTGHWLDIDHVDDLVLAGSFV
jgi:phosphoenolpyruvate phosphomutase